MSDPYPQMLEQLETAGTVNRHAKNPLGIERKSCSEETERVGVRLLIVDTWWTKKEILVPFWRVKSSDIDIFDLDDDNCGRRHCAGVSDNICTVH